METPGQAGQSREARAVVLRSLEEGPRLETVTIDPPRPGEVLVRVAASGVCGSDLHVLAGRSEAMTLPVVLGHEGAGVVEAVGDGVTSVAEGDHVVIALYGPCHRCGPCSVGRFPQCEGPERVQAIVGRMADGSTRLRGTDGEPLHPMVGAGTLCERAVVREAQVVRIDPAVPLELACLAGCGVTTGVGAVFNTARVEPGQTVAVVGCGGVGLNVVQAARVAGAGAVVALDTNPAKLELAAKLGATATVTVPAGPGDGADGSGAPDIAGLLAPVVPGGVDVAFEVVGQPELIAQTFRAVRPGGTCVMVGSPPPGSTIPIDGRALFADRRVLGCLGGGNVPARDIPRILDLYRQGRLDLDALVSARRPLEEFAAAIDETRRGEVARSVVLLA
ncbi:MAG TPA: alcohol dehydrogenase catalytic domain-containing protein [Acidimicrobiales bacterium]